MEPVQEVLVKQGVQFRVSGKDLVTRCLNPDHDDKNPSFRIDRTTGIAHCFSCGFKTNIFKHFGLLTNNTSVKVAKLKNKLKDLYVSYNGVDFPETKIPYNKSFRGISAQLLREFDAFYCQGREEYTDRVWFPIKDIRNRVVSYVGRHTMSSGNPRYLIYPSGSSMPVYPEMLPEKASSIILVEGIFDMLNCWDKGLRNVVCTFGTSTLYKEAAIKLLPFKTQGIQKIYLMFDGDDPGREAMQKLKPILEEAEYQVEIIELEEDTDPGELTKEAVDSIKEYIKNELDTRAEV